MNQTLSNLQVSYTYHIHEGNVGTTANGCYTKAVYHTHTGSSASGNGCYTNAITCTSTFTYQSSYFNQAQNHQVWTWICNGCGRGVTTWDSSNPGVCNYTYYSLGCGKSTSTIEKYSLGCGKTTETIDSATIIY